MQRGWIVVLAALLLLATGVAIRNWQDWRTAQGRVDELQAANQTLENEKLALERAKQVLEREKRELTEKNRKAAARTVELQTEIRRVVATAAAPKPSQTVRVTPALELDGAWPSVNGAAVAGDFRAPRQRQAAIGAFSIEQRSGHAPVVIPLHVWIDTNGRVENVEVVGERTELALLAAAEVQKLSYEPARHRGGPTSADMYMRMVISPG